MVLEIQGKRRMYRDAGTPLAEADLLFPSWENLPAPVAAYYGEMERAFWAFGENVLFPAAQRAYRESEDPRKRFSFRRYLLRMRAEGKEENGFLSVSREVRLRAGDGETVLRFGEVFRLSDGKLCPLSSFLSGKEIREHLRDLHDPRTAKRIRRDVRGGEYCLRDGGILLFSGRDTAPVFFPILGKSR